MNSYQDPDVLHIEIEFEDRELFALGDLPGFEGVDFIESGQMKDAMCMTSICRRESDDSFWSYEWCEHLEAAGTDQNDYTVDSYIHRVNRVIIGKTRTVVDWVRARA